MIRQLTRLLRPVPALGHVCSQSRPTHIPLAGGSNSVKRQDPSTRASPAWTTPLAPPSYALGAIAVLEYRPATAAPAIGSVLPDEADNSEVHLWGHLQEAALARIGLAFDRDDLIQATARSADELLSPVALRAFAAHARWRSM